MSFELPMLSAFSARMPDAEVSLAAFGVSLSLLLLIESPILMLLSLSAALTDGRESLRYLFRFSLLLCAASSCLIGVLLIGPIFDLVTLKILALPPHVAEQ